MEKNKSKLLKSRRGLASVLGLIFFIIFISALFGALTLQSQYDTQLGQTENIVSQQQNLIRHENFTISNTCVDELNNRLFIEVSNGGSNHIEFADIWIINSSLTSEPASIFEVDLADSFVPFNDDASILRNQPLYMTPGTYDIKVVTSLGTTSTFSDLEIAELGDEGGFIDDFVSAGSGGLDAPEGLIFHTDGNFYVASEKSHQILRYHGTTGAFIDVFAELDNTGVNSDCKKPLGMEFGSDGHLYVASEDVDAICKIDGTTGLFLEYFVTDGLGGLSGPADVTFSPIDGNLYVTGESNNKVLRYSSISGGFIDTFATAGMAKPKFLTFHNGDLFVSSEANDKITQFDGTLGGQKTDFIPSSDTRPNQPEGIVWGSDGNLYVSSEDDDSVFQYDSTGAFLKVFVTSASGGLDEPADLVWGPDGNLYVASEATDEVLRYEGFGPAPFFESSDNFECSQSTSAPTAPPTVPTTPTSLIATSGPAEVSLTWVAPLDGGSAITDYTIQYKESSSGTWLPFTDGTSANTSATVTGLTDGTSYDFRVAAVNSVGTGPYSLSASATPVSPPGAPTSLITTPAIAEVSLSWTAPGNNGGAAITDYIVQYKLTSSGTWLTFADGTSTSTSATVTGLAGGSSYDFQVAAVNSAGTGTYSDTSSATPTSEPTVPDAPTSLIATSGSTQVSLSWTAPGNNGGAAITDYIVQYKLTSDSEWLTFADGTSTSTSATVTGLAGGSSYDFQVAAVNSAGTGAYSSTASATPTNAPNGAFLGIFASDPTLDEPFGVTFGPDGHLYVSSKRDDRVVRFNGASGVFIDEFVTVKSGGLDEPHGLVFGPDGHLYVSSKRTDEIIRYDGSTGALIDVFASGGGLDDPFGLTFGSDGHLYVASKNSDEIIRFNGASGASMGTFASGGGLDEPQDLVFGSDGHLYVTSKRTDNVIKYDGTTGVLIGAFASGGGLNDPWGLTFGPDGYLYVASKASDQIIRYDGTTGAFVSVFVTAGTGGLNAPHGLVFGSDDNLYVSSKDTDQILKYD